VRVVVVALAALAVLAVAPRTAIAAEITVLCPRGVQAPVTSVAEAFTRETGHAVRFVFGTAGGLQARAAGEQPADVVITSVLGVEVLGRRGAVAVGSRVDLGRVGVGVAVASAALVPDIATPEALREALLAAPSIGYADPARGGQGGIHFASVIERLGIADSVRGKTRLFPEGLAALQAVATGELALAAAPISEIIATPGLRLAGPLPPSLQARLAYAAALLIRAAQPDAARAFLTFLGKPEARKHFTAAGFEASE
jgi:molybdate transport system substrate-binding protein